MTSAADVLKSLPLTRVMRFLNWTLYGAVVAMLGISVYNTHAIQLLDERLGKIETMSGGAVAQLLTAIADNSAHNTELISTNRDVIIANREISQGNTERLNQILTYLHTHTVVCPECPELPTRTPTPSTHAPR